MKNFYSSILLLFLSFGSTAQIVSIPDANFKAALTIPGGGIDTNGNGEVEVSEALGVSILHLTNLNISSLQGIEAFTNLGQLWAANNNLTTIDITYMTQLYVIDVSHNNLTGIDFSNQNLLIYLDISYNQINNINLPVIHYSDMIGFNISGNNYTSVAFAPGTVLTSFICNDTHLTSLDLSGVTFNYDTTSQDEVDLSIANNPQLEFINLRNGTSQLCTPFTDEYNYTIYCGQLNLLNNPSLTGICVDSYEYYFFQNYFSGQPNVVVSSYCSLSPVGQYNTISGNITLDCGNSNVLQSNQNIAITNTIITEGHTYSNTNGQYVFYVSGGSHNVALQLENPAYFTVTPPSYTYNLPFSGGNAQTANFCISPNGVHPDLEITILPINAARPGFDAQYKIVYKNKGNQTQTGAVTMDFEDAILNYVSSSVVPSSQNTNNVSWNFIDLTPFESRSISVTFNLNSPQETPPVNNGDILHYTANISSSQTDDNPENNTAILNQNIVGSFDPNDKIVLEGTQITEIQADDYLHYVVRFQNTGTYLAEKVVVKDILSSELDWNTLEMVSSSHPYRSTLTNGNKLEVFYENINLPSASDNEEGSHGYIAFKIKPANTFVLNNIINNQANIFFDFNFPIVTNTVSTTFTTLGISANEKGLFKLYPNPTSGIINIGVSNNQPIKATITTILGQTVMRSESTTIDISSLTKGTYLITVETDSGKETQRIIKL